MKLLVVRHGQDQDNANRIMNGRRDEPLTELGREQATIVAGVLNDRRYVINNIYCSPLHRAVDSATIIAQHMELAPPIISDLLTERSFGSWEGKPIAEAEQAIEMVTTDDGHKYWLEVEGMESLADLTARSKQFLEELPRGENQTVLVVTHNFVGKAIESIIRQVDYPTVMAEHYFHHTDVLEFTL